MSHRVGYEITIGEVTLTGGDDPESELAGLDITRSATSPSEGGTIVLHAVADAGGDLLGALADAAMGAVAGAVPGLGGGGAPPAFETKLRGTDIAAGANVTVKLEGLDGMGTVLIGSLRAMELSAGTLTLKVATGLARLAAARVGGSFQNRTTGQIIGDLAGQVGVDTGTLEPGDLVPAFVVDPRQNTLATVQDLAARQGQDLWIDEDGKLQSATFRKVRADHILRYGAELLAAELASARPALEGAAVVGEGAAASRGPTAWNWVLKDPAGVSASAGSGVSVLQFSDGAIRTRAAADRAASSRAGGMRDRARQVRLLLLGHSGIRLMNAIELQDLPRTEMNGTYKVTGLRHRFGPGPGFVTQLDATATGGAGLMGGLLGGLGSLVGGLGL